MPDDHDLENEVSRLRALLAECQERLFERGTLTVSAADGVIRHLFSLGLQLNAMERLTEDLELRRRIAAAIEETDAAITELRTVIFDDRNREHPDS